MIDEVKNEIDANYIMGKTMIVTKGIGNSILNVRFFCVPEIVVIEFE